MTITKHNENYTLYANYATHEITEDRSVAVAWHDAGARVLITRMTPNNTVLIMYDMI